MNTNYQQRNPRSLQEARERHRNLINEIQTIEAQLGSPTRRDLYPDYEGYKKWRNDALVAYRIRLTELRFIKDWITTEIRKRSAPVLNQLRSVADGREVIALQVDREGRLQARFDGENHSQWVTISEMPTWNLMALWEGRDA